MTLAVDWALKIKYLFLNFIFPNRLIRSIFEDGVDNLESVLREIQQHDDGERRRRDEDFEATKRRLSGSPILARYEMEGSQIRPPRLLHEELVCAARLFPAELLADLDQRLLEEVMAAMLRLLHILDVLTEVEKKGSLVEKVREATTNYRGTPLHYAAGISAAHKVRLLLERQADARAKDVNNRVPNQSCIRGTGGYSASTQATLDVFYQMHCPSPVKRKM